MCKVSAQVSPHMGILPWTGTFRELYFTWILGSIFMYTVCIHILHYSSGHVRHFTSYQPVTLPDVETRDMTRLDRCAVSLSGTEHVK